MRGALLLLLAAALSGCSENVQRNVYESFRQSERQRCLQQGMMNCTPVEDYDDYQQRRKELEETR